MPNKNYKNYEPYAQVLAAILDAKTCIHLNTYINKPYRPRPNAGRRTFSKRETRKWLSNWCQHFVTTEQYEICAQLYRAEMYFKKE